MIIIEKEQLYMLMNLIEDRIFELEEELPELECPEGKEQYQIYKESIAYYKNEYRKLKKIEDKQVFLTKIKETTVVFYNVIVVFIKTGWTDRKKIIKTLKEIWK